MYVLNRRMFQRGKDNKYFWFHEQSNIFFRVKAYLCCIKENSMTVNEARLIYFSPTHTSKQVAEAIVHGTGIKNVVSDESHIADCRGNCDSYVCISCYCSACIWRSCGSFGYGTSEVVSWIGYSCRIGRGLRKPRLCQKALMELDAFAIPHGFKVIAGATFIGEHSYSTDKCPIADGRPE